MPFLLSLSPPTHISCFAFSLFSVYSGNYLLTKQRLILPSQSPIHHTGITTVLATVIQLVNFLSAIGENSVNIAISQKILWPSYHLQILKVYCVLFDCMEVGDRVSYKENLDQVSVVSCKEFLVG